MAMGVLDWVTFALVTVGALNWGLVGIFGFDLVAAVLGEKTVYSRVVYTLVGVAAVYGVVRIATL